MSVQARIIVHPPDEQGGRRVRYDRLLVGIAYRPSDLVEFLRKAGALRPEDIRLDDDRLVEWRGGGPELWATAPPGPE
ncbi:hypothetical protein ACPXCE_19855 [Streptomyces sp. DT24]|uniref:hypothetical protein n=1 Tax=unclassified Streptomyces TaxID=2593676 RepID=UPI0023B9AAB2|nr:hypothetical protein [Streptomyces sp. AM 4-1-1]WEH33217.1 hypothetical protein PZB75_07385 [Streptomyces sp. AM 4-1-1]